MVGRRRRFTPDGEESAIRKEPVDGPVRVTKDGPEGDEHVYHGHGGPEKAVLQFDRDRYQTFRSRFPEFQADIDGARRGFGENISAAGMSEDTVCIGDRYRIAPSAFDEGESSRRDGVVVEVTGHRQPCYKLGINSGVRELPRIMQEEGATGWYYRVIEEGYIASGDEFTLLARPNPQWPVGEFIRRFYGTPLDREYLESALQVDKLGTNLKQLIESRLKSGNVESWDSRLYGT